MEINYGAQGIVGEQDLLGGGADFGGMFLRGYISVFEHPIQETQRNAVFPQFFRVADVRNPSDLRCLSKK